MIQRRDRELAEAQRLALKKLGITKPSRTQKEQK